MAFCELLLTTGAKLHRSKYDYKPNLGTALVAVTVCTLTGHGAFLREASLLNYGFWFPRQHREDALTPCFLLTVHHTCSALTKTSVLHATWNFLSVLCSNVSFQGLPCPVYGKGRNSAYWLRCPYISHLVLEPPCFPQLGYKVNFQLVYRCPIKFLTRSPWMRVALFAQAAGGGQCEKELILSHWLPCADCLIYPYLINYSLP